MGIVHVVTLLAWELAGYPGAPRQADLLHQRAELVLDVGAREVRGVTTLKLAPLRADLETLVLDGAGLVVESAAVDGETASASVVGETVQVVLPRARPPVGAPLEVRLRYRTQPRRGMHFPSGSTVGAYTQNQPHLTRHWLPTVDTPQERATFELVLTVPSPYSAHGSGTLVSDEDAGRGARRVTRRVDVPVPPYLLSVVVARLGEVSLPSGAGGPKATAHVPAGREADARAAFALLPKVLESLQRWTGVAYPFPTLDFIVVDGFAFNGMENAAAPTVDTTVLPEPGLSVEDADRDLWVHELAHQWFGVNTVVAGEADLWIQEGLATYLAHLVDEDLSGAQEARADFVASLVEYGPADDADRAIDVLADPDPEAAFDDVTYGRGALVFHLLRARVGDAAFAAILRVLQLEHRGGVLDRADLLRAIHAVTGVNHDDVIAAWTVSAGQPRLGLEVQTDGFGRGTVVRLRQDGPVRPLFLTLTLGHAGGETRVPLWATAAETWLAVPDVRKAEWLVVDEERWLTTTPPEVPAALSLAALRRATNPTTRAAAIRNLVDEAWTPVPAALLEVLRRDEHPLVRAAAAEALAEHPAPTVVEALTTALRDPSPRVQAAAAGALCEVGDVQTARALARVAGAPGRMEAREAAGYSLGCHVKDAPDLVDRALRLQSAGRRVEAAVVYGIAARDPQHPLLLETLRKGNAPLARAAADVIVPSGARAPVVDALVRRLGDPDHELRAAAALALARLGATESLPALRAAEQTESVGPARHAMRRAVRGLARP